MLPANERAEGGAGQPHSLLQKGCHLHHSDFSNNDWYYSFQVRILIDNKGYLDKLILTSPTISSPIL